MRPRRAPAQTTWLCLFVICTVLCVEVRAQPAVETDGSQKLLIGVVVDTHPQQKNVIGFERQVVDSLTSALAGVAADGFVIGYSDRVQLIGDWAPADSGLKEAAARIALDSQVSEKRGAVLNDALMSGLTRLASADGDRKSLIVIGEGNDGGSAVKFSQVLDTAKTRHVQCFALLVAEHRSQVGRVRQFGFDLHRLASGTKGKAFDVRTNPKSLDTALKDVVKRLLTPVAKAGDTAG